MSVLFHYRGPTVSATRAHRHASEITPSSECPGPDIYTHHCRCVIVIGEVCTAL